MTYLKAIVKRKSSGVEYFVTNGVSTRQPDDSFKLSHYRDLFSGQVYKNGQTKGRVFSMYENEFDIVEIKEQLDLPKLIK